MKIGYFPDTGLVNGRDFHPYFLTKEEAEEFENRSHRREQFPKIRNADYSPTHVYLKSKVDAELFNLWNVDHIKFTKPGWYDYIEGRDADNYSLPGELEPGYWYHRDEVIHLVKMARADLMRYEEEVIDYSNTLLDKWGKDKDEYEENDEEDGDEDEEEDEDEYDEED